MQDQRRKPPTKLEVHADLRLDKSATLLPPHAMPKQQRPKVTRTASELKDLLEDTVDALVAACARFDRGDTREYRQLASLIRNLCRDTRMSHSLLGQNGLKDRCFLSSSPTILPGNKLSECHLIELLIRPKLPDKPASWRAVLDASPMAFIPFEDWWSAAVVVQPEGESFSRSDIIGYIADQDGGVHVDPAIDAAFENMRNEAFTYTDGRATTEHTDRHAVRQIAHELIKSLRPSYRRSHQVTGAHATFQVPIFSEVGTPQTVRLVSYHLTPADSACPCKSGLSFELCHKRGAVPPAEMQQVGGEFVAPPGAAYARVGFGAKPH